MSLRPASGLTPKRAEEDDMGGGHVEELTIIVAPVVLGGGKRLFDGFTQPLELEQAGVRQSPLATFIGYRVTG
jgi:dihydrofolate reductase